MGHDDGIDSDRGETGDVDHDDSDGDSRVLVIVLNKNIILDVTMLDILRPVTTAIVL